MKNLILVLLAWCFCAQAQMFDDEAWYEYQQTLSDNHEKMEQEFVQAFNHQISDLIKLNDGTLEFKVLNEDNRIMTLNLQLDLLYFSYQTKSDFDDKTTVLRALESIDTHSFAAKKSFDLIEAGHAHPIIQCAPYAIVFPSSVPSTKGPIPITYLNDEMYILSNQSPSLNEKRGFLIGVDCELVK